MAQSTGVTHRFVVKINLKVANVKPKHKAFSLISCLRAVVSGYQSEVYIVPNVYFKLRVLSSMA